MIITDEKAQLAGSETGHITSVRLRRLRAVNDIPTAPQHLGISIGSTSTIHTVAWCTGFRFEEVNVISDP
jgi:hypothetical protein